jgi:uncharacterized protein YbbC (DUF1343 family)
MAVSFEDEQLNRMMEQVRNKRVGVITNPTGVDSDFVMMIDKLLEECQ